MIQYIEAPDQSKAALYPSVFLAGGITNCPNWQKELITYLDEADIRITVFNPRRDNFPIDDPLAAQAQIQWEYHRLKVADLTSFWFSRGSMNPIVLFEYGMALGQKREVCLGIDTEYIRRQDVVLQTALIDSYVLKTISYSIERLAYEILRYLSNVG